VRAAAARRPFALVLLDLTVRGGMGGSQTMQVLQARDPAVCAVLMTGYNNEETFRDYARHGFKHALAKPFPAETLRRVVTEILGPVPRPK
ncbi:MAG TPA: response regulator, partial [Opitutus sp.]|nr:response regulator [Opitutus sp.]